MIPLSPAITLAAGLLLLFTGRRLFWLAAALAAFLFIYPLVHSWLGEGLAAALIAVGVGLVFAWLAIAFFRTSAMVVGALMGAVGLALLFSLLGIQIAWWLAALIGAVLGVILITVALDWGLIVMTSWLGANLLAGDVTRLGLVSSGLGTLIFVVLLVVGVIAQAAQGRGGKMYRR